MITVSSHHAEDLTPYNSVKIFWNTFERDWNRSMKFMGTGEALGKSYNFGGCARYDEDWYTFIPSTITNGMHNTPFEWFNQGATFINYESWKSFYDVVKI